MRHTHVQPSKFKFNFSLLLSCQAVRTFTLPVAAVAAHMRAIAQLAPAGKAGAQWHVALLSDAERELSAFVSQAGGGSASGDRHDPVFGGRDNDGSGTMSSLGASEQRAATAVFTVGEAALLQGARAPGGVVVLVQALTAGRLMPRGGSAAGSPAAEGASVPGPLQVGCLMHWRGMSLGMHVCCLGRQNLNHVLAPAAVLPSKALRSSAPHCICASLKAQEQALSSHPGKLALPSGFS